MLKPIKISIDTINNDTVANYSNIRKGDTLSMTISIYQGSASLDLTGQTVYIILKKADGYCVEKSITGATGNIINITFSEQATLAVGDVIGEVQLIDSNGTNITNWFTYEVGESLTENIIINSKNEIETLSQIVALINSYNLNADNLAKQNELALQHETKLTDLNTTSENLISTLETDIITGKALDETLKSDFITGNALDKKLNDDFTIGNLLHNTLVINIADGNEVIAQLQNNANWALIQQMFDLINKMSISNLDDENGDYLIDENNIQFIG